MKRIVSIFLSALFLLSLVSCTDAAVTPDPSLSYITIIPNDKVSEFSEFFDSYLEISEDSTHTFLHLINTISYQEKKISEMSELKHKDTSFGWSKSASGSFPSKRSYKFIDCYENSEGSERYSTSIYTEEPLDGLVLPCGITFEDDIDSALLKIGAQFDRNDDFVAEKNPYFDDPDVYMTIFRDENRTVLYEDFNRTKTPGDTWEPFSIIYIETQIEDGKEITKEVTLSFSIFANNTLSKVKSEVVTIYTK